jgi:hypothetical protein
VLPFGESLLCCGNETGGDPMFPLGPRLTCIPFCYSKKQVVKLDTIGAF